MNRIYFITLLLFFIGCYDNSNRANFNDELYRIILDYQKNNPIPSNKQIEETTPLINAEKSTFIYNVTFYKENKDTLVSIKLLFGLLDDKNKFGIFSDKNMKRTVITDECICSKGFVTTYKRVDIHQYILRDAPVMDTHVDRYVYKINGKKISFVEKLKF